MFGLNKKSS